MIIYQSHLAELHWRSYKAISIIAYSDSLDYKTAETKHIDFMTLDFSLWTQCFHTVTLYIISIVKAVTQCMGKFDLLMVLGIQQPRGG